VFVGCEALMSRRWLRPRRVWTFLILGMVALISAGFLADRYFGDGAPFPWRFQARQRAEADALARGHAYLEQGRFRRAILAVSQIREGSSSEAEALTIRGVAEASLEEVSPARRDLERAWDLRPNAAAARVLAAIYLSANETDRGFQMLLSASRIDPRDFRPWYAMGELVHLRSRRYKEAVEAFRQALERRPDHQESRLGLVEALAKSHHPHEAEPILNGLLPERPHDSRLLALAAEVSVELDRSQDAERFLERSLAIDPDRHDAWVLQARMRMRQGRPKEALAAAERASALEPNDPVALGLVGSIQAALGLKEEAARTLNRRQLVERRNQEIENLTREILEKPDDLALRCRLGRMASDARMKTLAIQSYQAALALAPDCGPARQGLIDLGVPSAQIPPAR
jgi:tetratricopeptide (TPR) repeat protein